MLHEREREKRNNPLVHPALFHGRLCSQEERTLRSVAASSWNFRCIRFLGNNYTVTRRRNIFRRVCLLPALPIFSPSHLSRSVLAVTPPRPPRSLLLHLLLPPTRCANPSPLPSHSIILSFPSPASSTILTLSLSLPLSLSMNLARRFSFYLNMTYRRTSGSDVNQA